MTDEVYWRGIWRLADVDPVWRTYIRPGGFAADQWNLEQSPGARVLPVTIDCFERHIVAML